MQKNSFVIRTGYADIVNEMSDKQAGQLLKAIFNYAAEKEIPELTDVEVKMAFRFVKQDLDYDDERYRAKVEHNRKIAQLGGAPKGNQNAQKQPTGLKNNPAESVGCKTTLNDNDSDNDNESDKDILKKEKDKKEKKSASRFIKPTVAEIHAYCLQRQNGLNAQSFFDYYESKGWRIGTCPMKDWQAAVRTWERHQQTGGAHGNQTDYNRTPTTGKYAGFGRRIEGTN